MKNIVRDIEKNRLLITDDTYDSGGGRSDFREKMLMNNHLEGILEMKAYVTDNRKNYEYDTTGLSTLDSFFHERKPDREILKNVFTGIAETVINAENYMLEENDFIIGPDYVFLDKNCRPFMAYCPGYGKALSEQLGSMAEYFMNRIDYHDQKAVLMTYTLYMQCREEGFCIADIKKYLNDENMIEAPEEKRENVYEQEWVGEPKKKIFRPDDDLTFLPKENDNKKGGRINLPIAVSALLIPVILTAAALGLKLLRSPDGKTDSVKLLAVVILGAGIAGYIIKKYAVKPAAEPLSERAGLKEEATELLFDRSGMMAKEETFMLLSDDHPKIVISSFPFYIGKDRAHMDFFLDRQGVSRYHVKIDRSGQGYSAEDLSSTNGTYVNGERLLPNIPSPIKGGDTINIGICTYTVKIVNG